MEIVEGEVEACVNITIVDDDILESLEPESFNVTLSSSDTSVTFLSPSATVSINDSSGELSQAFLLLTGY